MGRSRVQPCIAFVSRRHLAHLSFISRPPSLAAQLVPLTPKELSYRLEDPAGVYSRDGDSIGEAEALGNLPHVPPHPRPSYGAEEPQRSAPFACTRRQPRGSRCPVAAREREPPSCLPIACAMQWQVWTGTPKGCAWPWHCAAIIRPLGRWRSSPRGTFLCWGCPLWGGSRPPATSQILPHLSDSRAASRGR